MYLTGHSEPPKLGTALLGQPCTIEAQRKPRLKFSSYSIFKKSKKKQVTLILTVYVIQPNISKTVSFQHASNY